jgi:GTP-binding protein YchF
MGKKKAAASTSTRLGRPGNNVKMGIVGLPNVGKSSFFNLLCKMDVPAENFPFCTIEPSLSRVPVPDKRFDQLVKFFKPKSVKPAVLGVTDIAGLVKGASEGAGLGNAFLSNIQAVDGIFHMVRVFKDKNVTHVESSIDPLRDIEIINDELRLKDIQILETLVNQEEKMVSRGIGGKEAKALYDVHVKAKELLEGGTALRFGKWMPKEADALNQLQLLTAKPQIFLVNMTRKGYFEKRSNWLPKIAEYLEKNCNELMIPFSVAYEQELFDMGEEAAAAQIKDTGVKSALPNIIKKGYHALNLIHFFTAGADEVRGWTIQKGWFAPQAAGTIHGDFEKGFICAEVYPFKEFRKHGSEKAVKDAGLCRQQGKTYVVADGDVCHFKFNAPKQSKKPKK